MINISQVPVFHKNRMYIEVNIQIPVKESFYIPLKDFVKIDKILRKERKRKCLKRK